MRGTRTQRLLLCSAAATHCCCDRIKLVSAIVSHEYDFIDDVCTDITHYDNNGVLGTPCRFVYYPMTFRQFQQLRPEIAAGLPASGKATGAADDGTGYVDPRTGLEL